MPELIYRDILFCIFGFAAACVLPYVPDALLTRFRKRRDSGYIADDHKAWSRILNPVLWNLFILTFILRVFAYTSLRGTPRGYVFIIITVLLVQGFWKLLTCYLSFLKKRGGPDEEVARQKLRTLKRITLIAYLAAALLYLYAFLLA